ncbi:hypothetical protein [Bacillus cereus group sp. TH152-1LC]|uniref:hypothetical protein n=1 Tax=Bacillus cereus group sp. TH152-1LC TaxID=3018060 RepID=UPI0022DED0F7|nr:hypothetical protein [Bacillus cereus group sp. TH152-1LC]MDA1675273.1 hypothetical protein [Bacillus cereus group sp. TH152-1LC]
MEYGYSEKEFGLINIVNKLNKRILNIKEIIQEEKVSGEVESITLKDVSLNIVPAVDDYDEIKVFTHRFAVNFYGDERGRYINVVTFHSPDIYKQDYQAFFPNDFEIVYEEDEVRIESKYVLSEEEKEIIDFMNKIRYQNVFDREFKADVINFLDKIGYEIEESDSE